MLRNNIFLAAKRDIMALCNRSVIQLLHDTETNLAQSRDCPIVTH